MVADRVGDVTRASVASYGSTIKVIWAAQDLAEPVEALKREVDSFLDTVRNA